MLSFSELTSVVVVGLDIGIIELSPPPPQTKSVVKLSEWFDDRPRRRPRVTAPAEADDERV